VSTRAIDRYAYAHDASHYLLIPNEVIKAEDTDHVVNKLREACVSGVPITFRSGGTSLSGQAVTDSLMLDTRTHFKKIEVLDNGARVRVQPGATVREVNTRLARFGYKLGPDPASEAACTIGGVIANNSSGMVCGTEFNTYKTLESMVLVFADGTRINTADKDADIQLKSKLPALYEVIVRLRGRIHSQPYVVAEIKRQFSIKNTMGYGVNAFLDFTSPIDIISHLIIGSEGTLAFVAEATFRTVPIKPHVATSLLVFDSLQQATLSLSKLVESGLAAIELLDSTSLKVAQSDPKAPRELQDIQVQNHSALLIEFQELNEETIGLSINRAQELLSKLSVLNVPQFHKEPKVRGDLWHIRKGLYATVAGNRPSGTTALLEDIAVPISFLAETCNSLVTLFAKHNYQESVIFGHAKDGNIHFLLNERFDDKLSLARYSKFTEDMVELVLGNSGTLKAEHGTGRIMAPFVKRQYGEEIYAIMREIKASFDPRNILNPGIMISDDSELHIKSLKSVPSIEKEVDRCVECGYCEPACPSKNITLTPRQRIVLRRELVSAQQRGDIKLQRDIEREYSYDGVDTCAVDGMCQVACPVLINTGDLVRRLRDEQAAVSEKAVWSFLSKQWNYGTQVLSSLISLAHKAPTLSALTLNSLRKISNKVPLINTEIVSGGKVRTGLRNPHATVVYFPSCTSTIFGGSTPDAFLELCEKAGVEVKIPKDIAGVCCGTPWKSKGMRDGYRSMRAKTGELLNRLTRDGSIPIVSDSSSCTQGLSEINSEYHVIDVVTFTLTKVVPTLKLRKISALALHPTCSSTQLGINDDLVALGKLIADHVYVPDAWSCCAYAGDRGAIHPELTESATRAEADEIKSQKFDRYASCNRTCEIGMSQSTGQKYQHIIELVNEFSEGIKR
jgi:D-lactate dehydrogenase